MYKDVIWNARTITIKLCMPYVYKHSILDHAWLKHNKGEELIRWGITRFDMSFLTLQSLVDCKSNLKCFEWDKQARKGNGLDICDFINTHFWLAL